MNGIRESLCVQMLGENEELVTELESEVNEHYDLMWKEICKYAQFQRLVEDFNSGTDTSFTTLFARAFSCTENNSETYHAIREIFLKIMFTCQQIEIRLNSTIRSIETVTITLVSFYKYLQKNNKQKKAANRIFKHIKEFQSQTIVVSVSDAVKESQNLLSIMEEIKSRNPEPGISDKLYKLLQPVKIMHFCLDELSNTNYYMDIYYNILKDALFGTNVGVDTDDTNVDVNTDITWTNSTTRKLFLKYFRSLLATRIVCIDFINDIEKLRDNFQQMIHCLPITEMNKQSN